jgi:segregation and condensation protein A
MRSSLTLAEEQQNPTTAETAPVTTHAEPKLDAAALARKKRGEESSFAITVGEVYDGPLDLLLDLIRKQDIDIYDIPIAQITAQYLQYVERIKQFDVDIASEFIYMASVLIQIKSRMLLPRDPEIPGVTQEDPRAELVSRLLEHEKFKMAAQMLLQRQQIEEAVLTNPALKEFKNQEGTEPELAADVVDLMRTFQQILDRARHRPVINVDEEQVTVTQMIDYFKRRLNIEERPIRLKSLLRALQTRNALVCAFLALLEMVRLQAIMLRQEHVFGEIIIKKSQRFEEAMSEHEAVRDDWR